MKYISSKASLLVIVFLSYIIYQYQNKPTSKRSLLFPFNHTFSTSSLASTRDPNEKYLTFFTHSGFQNQLIQVENGILLAWYLNRTLILPKAVLGESFGWNHFAKLQLQHKLRDTDNDYCKQFQDKRSRKSASCPDPSKYALASFEDLFDLSWAKQHVRIEQRESSDFQWLEQNYGIKRSYLNNNQTTGPYIDGDILFFKDETRYDWRIYDIPVKNRFLGRYADSLDVSLLQNHSQRLIHFTSLFGTGKFPIKDPKNAQFFKTLQESITYKHPAVLKITDIVVEALGGAGNFVGAHLRTADGLFIKALPENIQYMIDRIPSTPSNHTNTDLLSCVALAKQKQTTLVFLATDAINPRKNPKVRHLWTHLPCTFTLDDILHNKHPLWIHMDQYRTLHTGQSMRKYLIPLVDALVASKGHLFVGTKGSTFSGYIRRLHKTYWMNK